MKTYISILFFYFIIGHAFAENDSLRFSFCINTDDLNNDKMPSYTKSIQVLDSLGRVIQSEEFMREGATINGTSTNIPDSIFRITSRDIYQYDAFSNLISHIHTYFNLTDSVISRFLYRYDATGKKIASEDYRLYPNPIALMGFDTSGYSGDSINYYLRMQWNGLLFDTANYYTINYDSLNRRTEELKHLYNGNFLGITKKFWSYLPTGEIDQIISKNQYGDSTRERYFYNSFNDILYTVSEIYNSDSSGWVSPYRLDYLYDINNFPYRIIYIPCLTPACLDTIVKKEWNYDSLGRLTRILLSNYEGQAYNMNTYSYDANGDMFYTELFYDDGGPCGAGSYTYYFYNSEHSVIHTQHSWYSCWSHASDCYFYDLGADSMMVDICYPLISCSNDTIYPVVISAGGISPHTYNWSPGIHFSDSIGTQPYVLSDTSRIYALTVTDSSGRIVSDTMNIAISIPFPNLGTDTVLCTNSMIELQPGNFYSYEWSDGSSVSSLQLTSSTEDSIYISVIVIDSSSCYGTDSVLVFFNDCTGIDEIQNTSFIYPNPFQDNFVIDFKGIPSLCYIYSHDGKLIKAINLHSGENFIETKNLASGIYVIVINEANNSKMKLIVKE